MTALQRLELRHPRGVSRIYVGVGAVREVSEEAEAFCRGRRVFLVSSGPVLALHESLARTVLAPALKVEVLQVPDGEAAKTPAVAEELWKRMLELGGKRDSRLVTLGGGSVSDLGGYAAACFLRGIEYAQIPTTLLAQVDASIGGKTGVDLPGAKNSVGIFHHPRFVLADTRVLSTLPGGELRSGLVEVIKMAALLDPDLLGEVEEHLEEVLAGDVDVLAPIVAAAIRAKIAVVEADPEEAGQRRLLNFGHTLGHALEAALDYQSLRHGEAVGYGLLFALRLAEKRGLAGDVGPRLRRLLLALNLPQLPPSLHVPELLERMRGDKKARELGPVWVLPEALGKGRMEEGIGWGEVEVELRDFLEAPLEGGS